MVNFKIDNPTIVHFGKDVIKDLGKVISQYGNKVLLVYGKGSIKRTGIYDAVIKELRDVNSEITEFSGIKPNPLVSDVDKASEIGRKENIDVILAVGGGSVIDSAKVVSVTIPSANNAWSIMKGEEKPQKAIPLVTVLTLAATGTEMNGAAVLSNLETIEKIGFVHRLMFPRHSFLDPQYTISVPLDHTVYGIVDLMAHVMENYFGEGEATLSDRFVFSILNEAVEYGPGLLKNLNNYELREKIMYAAAMALSGIATHGRKSGDWGVHSLGHVLSVLFDTPHAATLSIVYPAWMKYLKEKMPDRIALLGKAIFDTSTADESILAFEKFFKDLGSPVRLQQAGISLDKKELIVSTMNNNKAGGMHFKFDQKDITALVDLMYLD